MAIIDPLEPRWYAAYTKSRTEKKVLGRLTEAGFEAYLPILRKRHQWSDRLKWVEEPLIRSYIFIHVNEKEYYNAINTPGLVCYVTFEGKAAPIPDRQIDLLKMLLHQGAEMEVSNERFAAGQKIIVVSGTLVGMQGEMVEYRGKKKVLVRLGTTGTNLLVTVSLDLIEKE
ncbi:MAG: UpxY family transcription antiterminator [Bacteroidota bacterium]